MAVSLEERRGPLLRVVTQSLLFFFSFNFFISKNSTLHLFVFSQIGRCNTWKTFLKMWNPLQNTFENTFYLAILFFGPSKSSLFCHPKF
jgi:hypothetical protein